VKNKKTRSHLSQILDKIHASFPWGPAVPEKEGACCFEDSGICEDRTWEEGCVDAGGVFLGLGVECNDPWYPCKKSKPEINYK
jgi:hypothetical protein